MAAAKRARTAETPKPPSFNLRLRALYFYPTAVQIGLGALPTRKPLWGCLL